MRENIKITKDVSVNSSRTPKSRKQYTGRNSLGGKLIMFLGFMILLAPLTFFAAKILKEKNITFSETHQQQAVFHPPSHFPEFLVPGSKEWNYEIKLLKAQMKNNGRKMMENSRRKVFLEREKISGQEIVLWRWQDEKGIIHNSTRGYPKEGAFIPLGKVSVK
jgi:hypothetical protein